MQPEEQLGTVVTRGGSTLTDEVVEKAERSFDSALGAIHVVAERVVEQLRGLAAPPAVARVQFSLEFDAKAGAIVASAGATAQLQVDLTWHPSAGGARDPGVPEEKRR
ncbi:CU044_2847 family protein [Nocardia sp. NPDC004860]|uniref:CU044_2847 family protein n=1 Tax=Nocardia sp. NPDC004860 TaxID=3154557 RepID=UPI0033B6991F